MGFNRQATKHAGVREMVLAFQRSGAEQVAAFFGFVATNRLVNLISAKDWRKFARYYNGAGNIEICSKKLPQALKVVETLKRQGARFAVFCPAVT
jgi:hypothetical protein